MIRRSLLLALLGGACSVSVPRAFADDAIPIRIRGTITRRSGAQASVTSREGDALSVVIAPGVRVLSLVPARLEDIGPGAFIGSASLPQKDGTLRAMEIHVFPEAMRGAGEGFRPFDLAPDSAMLNGTVGDVTAAQGRSFTVGYKGGTKTLVVPEGTPIVTFAPGDPSLLAPGAHAFLTGSKAADGTITIDRAVVGRDGLVPPM
jgi:hypothetical protein